jgi:two-component system LytT family response regulator
MIKAIIVDDEPYCSESLGTLITRHCPEVELSAICGSGAEALKEIPSKNPQLVFLDIEMPHMNGFELIEKLGHIQFDVIFTTSYDQYAIKAIKCSALDYLLKPVDREELKRSVQKALQRQQPPLPLQLEILLQELHRTVNSNQNIAIPTLEDTHFNLKNNKKIIASRSLKEFEEMLEGRSFARVHHSFLVNLNEVQKYVKGEGGYLIMSDGTSVDVSRSRKEMLLRKLQPYRI